VDSSSDEADPQDRHAWTRALPWLALALLVVVAIVNAGGGPWAGWFVVPVGLALIALVFALRARRWLDVVVSAFVVLAIPLWLLGIVFLLQFTHPLDNNSFSP
jgi:hypothetical protein